MRVMLVMLVMLCDNKVSDALVNKTSTRTQLQTDKLK